MTLAALFFGRLHPLIVHLPIGFLIMAATFEVLSYFNKFKQLRFAVPTTLWIGAVSSVLAAFSGYLLSEEGGYDDRLLSLHMSTGIATAVFACLVAIIRKSVFTFFKDKRTRKQVRIFLFVPLIALLSIAGHFGGSLTHGEDYLFAINADQPSANPSIKLTSTVNLDSIILYRDVLEPILDSRCYSCHSSAKQKGQLRLDQVDLMLKGGKHGSVLKGVIPDSASLYARLMLPLDDEKHMPPNEKPQLTSSEIALIHTWIAEGASFDKKISAFAGAAKIKGYIQALIDQTTVSPLIPDKEVQPASHQAIEALAAQKILVLPVSTSTNYLSVSFVNARSLGNSDLRLLLPVRDQLLWLNLARTKVSDEGMEVISQLEGLTQLSLDYTAVGDSGVARLSSMPALASLNLVGTKVSDSGIGRLGESKSLKKLFLYQTRVTPNGIKNLLGQTPAIIADTGSYILPSRITDTLVYKARKLQ